MEVIYVSLLHQTRIGDDRGNFIKTIPFYLTQNWYRNEMKMIIFCNHIFTSISMSRGLFGITVLKYRIAS